jgi:drug/metabolite transporter (DMT)-like permease
VSAPGAGLGLLAALLYGAADLTGGLASRRSAALTVIVGAYAVSLPLVLAATIAEGGPPLTPLALGLALAGGVAEVVATLGLYIALAAGTMSIVSPFVGILGASLPLAVGLGLGEPLPVAKALGMALALVAIVAVAGPVRVDGSSRRALAFATVAGLGYGSSFVLFSLALSAGHGEGPWQVALVARIVGLAVAGVCAVATGRALVAPRGGRSLVGMAGLFDVLATTSLLAALGSGPLGLTSVLASLYPAVTVVLAASLLRERVGRLELAGIACALFAVVLMGSA